MNHRSLESEQDQSKVARLVAGLFDRWQLSEDEQVAMLGLPSDNLSDLERFKTGELLESDESAVDRSELLLNIHASLRRLFPHNPELRYEWISRPNRALDGKAPKEVVKSQGLNGLNRIASYLSGQLQR